MSVPGFHAGRSAVALLVFLLGLSAVVAGAQGTPTLVQLTDAQWAALAAGAMGTPPETGLKHPKIATSLLELARLDAARGDWRELAGQRGMLVDGESVLVELRVDHAYGRAAAGFVEALGGRIRHHNVPSLLEVWLPVMAVEKVAEHPDVHLVRPARLVEPTAGSALSEGVAALNVSTSAVSYDYHDLGADGTGITIANIDAGYANYAALQSSGDWPPTGQLSRFEVDGGPVVDCDTSTCSDYEAADHGAATMEIVFDMAPGADYLTYRTTTVGDWYTALDDVISRGADVVTVSLSAPLDNVGDGSECPPNWPAPCGTIAEAAAAARAAGILVVNSAGNYRLEHWGGTYADSGGALNWDGAGAVYNIGGPGGGYVYCYPNGFPLGIDLFWDDWTDVDHDYDLYLYELTRNGNSWRLRDSSELTQDGSAGQTPQEAIRYTVTGALNGGGICGAGAGIFSIVVAEYSAATDRNLQVFSSNWGGLWNSTPDRSLGFPADSPDVFSAGAVDVASLGTLEDYSSEGPVLGPGGSQGTPSPANPKPDGVSVSGVSTVTYGASGFGGTSSAAPHTAGVAAILTQLRNEKYASPPTANNPDGIHDLLATIALEDSTFPGTFDTTYGNGLVRLAFCDSSFGVTDSEWTMIGLPCNRRDSATVAEILGDDLDLGSVYWELWDWDATTASYEQLFETDQMTPGVGYWLLYEDTATADIQGLPADRSEAYPLTVVGETSALGRPNFLGHPFDFDVDWPDVTVVSGGSEYTLQQAFDAGIFRNYLWKPYTSTGYGQYDGLLGEGTLSSFDGFWVKAWQNAELRVPTSLAVTEAREEGTVESGRTVGWSVRLEAESDGVTAQARIGQLADSGAGWDAHDAELMPSFEAHQFYVVMPHPEWGELAGDYVRDYHAQRPRDIWSFQVRSNRAGVVVLRWHGPKEVLARSKVVDLETGEILPAVAFAKGYEFKMAAGRREFQWRMR
jgi:hypothetical protein